MAEAGFRTGMVALIGRPNVGKSTLFNALLGERLSIVSRRKQTTRNRIRGILNADSHQIVLVDTPGWQTSYGGEMNRVMRAAAERAAPDVDALAVVVDAAADHPDDAKVMALCPQGTRAVCVLNKIDLLGNMNAALPRIEQVAAMREFDEYVPVSALKGKGIGELSAVLRRHMPESPPLFGTDSTHSMSEGFIVQEFVREKLFRYLDEELPYVVAVKLVRTERSDRLLRLDVDIHVDQENRKRIIIGKGGEMIRTIGTAARKDLQRQLRSRIHLELRVKVTPNWTQKREIVGELGIGEIR